MKIKCCDWCSFRDAVIRTKARILMFGAGAIGQVSAPEILREYGLLSYVDCYLDNDQSKWGAQLEVCGKNFEIKPPVYLEECKGAAVILLNISRYTEVIRQLETMHCTEGMDCYIMPMMLLQNFCTEKSKGAPVFTDQALIPKKLHYMWLGKNPLPDNLQKCIESWKKYCPDYEIIEWNEDNYDIGKHIYMKHAYEAKAYGFVPDYARLDILYNEGGFYLDTDVELRRSIEDLRFQESFCGVEKWQIINFGGLSGSVKGHTMLKAFLDRRADVDFYHKDGSLNRNTCGFYDTGVALKYGYKINGETQCINGMNIFASDYFQPFDYMSGIINETENTYSVHWFNGGWLDEEMKAANEEAKQRYMEMYRRAIECRSEMMVHNNASEGNCR